MKRPPIVEQRRRRQQRPMDAERPAQSPAPRYDKPYTPVLFGADNRPVRNYARDTGIEDGIAVEFWENAQKWEADLHYGRELDAMRFGHNKGPTLQSEQTEEQQQSIKYAASFRALVHGAAEIHVSDTHKFIGFVARTPRVHRIWKWLVQMVVPQRVKRVIHDGAVDPSSIAPSYMNGRPGSKNRFMKSLKE